MANSNDELNPGFTLQWLDNRQLVVYSLQDANKEAVDTWAGSVANLIRNWPAEQPLALLLDFTEASYTPYIQQKHQEVYETNPNLMGFYAVVFPERLLQSVKLTFLKRNVKREAKALSADLRGEAFANYDEALNWLRNVLESVEV